MIHTYLFTKEDSFTSCPRTYGLLLFRFRICLSRNWFYKKRKTSEFHRIPALHTYNLSKYSWCNKNIRVQTYECDICCKFKRVLRKRKSKCIQQREIWSQWKKILIFFICGENCKIQGLRGGKNTSVRWGGVRRSIELGQKTQLPLTPMKDGCSQRAYFVGTNNIIGLHILQTFCCWAIRVREHAVISIYFISMNNLNPNIEVASL